MNAGPFRKDKIIAICALLATSPVAVADAMINGEGMASFSIMDVDPFLGPGGVEGLVINGNAAVTTMIENVIGIGTASVSADPPPRFSDNVLSLSVAAMALAEPSPDPGSDVEGFIVTEGVITFENTTVDTFYEVFWEVGFLLQAEASILPDFSQDDAMIDVVLELDSTEFEPQEIATCTADVLFGPLDCFIVDIVDSIPTSFDVPPQSTAEFTMILRAGGFAFSESEPVPIAGSLPLSAAGLLPFWYLARRSASKAK